MGTIKQRGVARGNSADSGEVEVYEIESLNRWPYESVTSVSFARPNERLALATKFNDYRTKYRCYLNETQYFNWVLVPHNFYRDSTVLGDEALEISPTRLLRPHERWIQLEYVISLSRAHRGTMGGLRLCATPCGW